MAAEGKEKESDLIVETEKKPAPTLFVSRRKAMGQSVFKVIEGGQGGKTAQTDTLNHLIAQDAGVQEIFDMCVELGIEMQPVRVRLADLDTLVASPANFHRVTREYLNYLKVAIELKVDGGPNITALSYPDMVEGAKHLITRTPPEKLGLVFLKVMTIRKRLKLLMEK